MQPLSRLVEGLSVALVGNSQGILRQDAGRQIDGADIVIRINRGIPSLIGHAKAIGTRTTVWATARYWPDAKPPDGADVLWMKLTKLGHAEWSMFLAAHPKAKVYWWPTTYEKACREYVGADPGTGIRLLWWLKTQAQPRAVSCYGMDCWTHPTHWSGQLNTPNHSPTLEHEAMMRLL